MSYHLIYTLLASQIVQSSSNMPQLRQPMLITNMLYPNPYTMQFTIKFNENSSRSDVLLSLALIGHYSNVLETTQKPLNAL